MGWIYSALYLSYTLSCSLRPLDRSGGSQESTPLFCSLFRMECDLDGNRGMAMAASALLGTLITYAQGPSGPPFTQPLRRPWFAYPTRLKEFGPTDGFRPVP